MLPGPVRKSGTAYLSPIPNEIYMEIFGYLRPTDPNEWIDAEARQHFRNLALVCRFFSSVMLPWIFENLTFVEKDSYSQISSPLSTTVSAKFCRHVLDGDTTALLLAKHVQRWAFLGSPTQSKWTPAFLSMYFRTFQHLPNLVELSLSNIVIPKDFFKRLANVPTLEVLNLDDSLFDGGVQEKHLKYLESLSLKRLALLRNSNLKRLIPHLNMSSLIHLDLDLVNGLQGLPPLNSSLPLESLQLCGLEDPLQVVELLEHTPKLKALHLWVFRPPRDFVLKSQIIPQLTELGASWPFCAYILPGRPISRLKLFSMPDLGRKDEEKILADSTKFVTHLIFPICSYADVPLWEHFPGLENLGIDIKGFRVTAWGEVCFVSSTQFSCFNESGNADCQFCIAEMEPPSEPTFSLPGIP